MLKILQARLQQYVNCELPDVQAGFRKGRGPRDQISNICWIMEKTGEFQINIYLWFIDYAKSFDCVDHNKLWKILKEMTNLDSILKSRDITLSTRSVYSKLCFLFSSSHVWMWELDHKESWAPKNWCFLTVALDKTLESPLDSKKIKPDNSKGNQSWIFIGTTDAENEAPILLAIWWEDSSHWKRPWCWARLKAGREEGGRGWDG